MIKPEQFMSTPDADHRVISVHNLHLPEFPDDNSIKGSVYDAMSAWVDHTLAANSVLSPDTHKAEIPKKLWVPHAGRGMKIKSVVDIKESLKTETSSVFGAIEDDEAVQTTTVTVNRSISEMPVSTSPSLITHFSDKYVDHFGDYRYGGGYNLSEQQLNGITRVRGFHQHNSGEYFNQKTGKNPNRHVAERMLLLAARGLLTQLGYDQALFAKKSVPFADHIEQLKAANIEAQWTTDTL